MRILVTGGSGFLGSKLARHLEAHGHDVATLARRPVKAETGSSIAHFVMSADYANIGEILETFRPEAVVHTAAASFGEENMRTVAETLQGDVMFGSLLLTEMKRLGVRRFVNCGSSWQNADGGAYSPFNFYAAAKEAFERIVDYFAGQGVQAVTLRLFDSYGPGDPRRKILNLMIDAAARNERIDMSPGLQKLMLVHIDDLCEAFHIALTSSQIKGVPHEIYSVADDKPLSLRDLAAILERVSGLKCQNNWGGRDYRRNEIMNPSRAFPVLPGWTPKIGIEEGIRLTAASRVSAIG